MLTAWMDLLSMSWQEEGVCRSIPVLLGCYATNSHLLCSYVVPTYAKEAINYTLRDTAMYCHKLDSPKGNCHTVREIHMVQTCTG